MTTDLISSFLHLHLIDCKKKKLIRFAFSVDTDTDSQTKTHMILSLFLLTHQLIPAVYEYKSSYMSICKLLKPAGFQIYMVEPSTYAALSIWSRTKQNILLLTSFMKPRSCTCCKISGKLIFMSFEIISRIGCLTEHPKHDATFNPTWRCLGKLCISFTSKERTSSDISSSEIRVISQTQRGGLILRYIRPCPNNVCNNLLKNRGLPSERESTVVR